MLAVLPSSCAVLRRYLTKIVPCCVGLPDKPRPSLRPDAPPKGEMLRTSGFDGAETDVLALGYRAGVVACRSWFGCWTNSGFASYSLPGARV